VERRQRRSPRTRQRLCCRESLYLHWTGFFCRVSRSLFCDIWSLLTLEGETNRDQDLGPLLLLLPDASSDVCEDLIVEVCAAMRGCMRGVCVAGEREDAQRVVVRVCVYVFNNYT